MRNATFIIFCGMSSRNEKCHLYGCSAYKPNWIMQSHHKAVVYQPGHCEWWQNRMHVICHTPSYMIATTEGSSLNVVYIRKGNIFTMRVLSMKCDLSRKQQILLLHYLSPAILQKILPFSSFHIEISKYFSEYFAQLLLNAVTYNT